MLPICAAIHDLSCYAKSSLTVVLPVLESMGIETCPLPTALLSTQTDGFDSYYFHDT
ncbi:MAG: pyridoxine kinase, partial [Sphaerochaeta sp.]|nr:pyridoxine kinase [Sphaerochaeta sp.]